MSELISTELNHRVLTIRLNRPEKKNALNLAMYDALTDALNGAGSDKAVRVIYVTGNGDAFTSGNDIMDFVQNPPKDENSPVGRFLQALVEAEKPLIAGVNGLAVGVGVTMLPHCDLVYAADTASFRMPFVSLGVVPEAGSSYLLPRIMGHQRAAELILLAESFSPQTAKECGLVNRIVALAQLEETAQASAKKLAELPPNAVRLSKALLKRGSMQAVQEAMSEEAKQFMPLLTGPEAMEAMQAFLERRKPDFSSFD